ncbi:MAG: saccharopine dehydrogenase [Polyangiaceae bacterium]|nr:saccharopine dehydrogenase [Polyangiaceae bacterium]
MTKSNDIVVYGATGYTGRLVVDHLARFGERHRWAIAGRDERKLQDLASAVKAAHGYEPPIFVASAEDRSSLAKMCERSGVVVACAGPFVRMGEPVVEACIDAGSDYVDITGEPAFVERIITRHHDRAEQAGVLVVPCCGFDSIPADLGVWFVMNALGKNGHATAETFVHTNWDVSGGTWQTMMEMAGHGDPLHPPSFPTPIGASSRTSVGKARPHFEPDVAGWVVPMPTIDPAVVLRSAAMLGTYGADFTYSFYARFGSLPKAALRGAALGAIFGLARVGPARRILSRVKPSGAGANEEQRRTGFFRVTTVARASGEKVVGRVSGGDKYVETGAMAGEAASLLALERATLPRKGGVLTPAVAFGGALVRRLEDRGIRFEIVRRTKEER